MSETPVWERGPALIAELKADADRLEALRQRQEDARLKHGLNRIDEKQRELDALKGHKMFVSGRGLRKIRAEDEGLKLPWDYTDTSFERTINGTVDIADARIHVRRAYEENRVFITIDTLIDDGRVYTLHWDEGIVVRPPEEGDMPATVLPLADTF